jgi:hypothetical protein
MVVLRVAIVAMATAAAAAFSARLRRILGRVLAGAIGGALGLYLVAGGIADFWIVDCSNPAGYRQAWGGPSLAGVFAVHSGLGFLIIIGISIWLWRRRRSSHPRRADATPLHDALIEHRPDPVRLLWHGNDI